VVGDVEEGEQDEQGKVRWLAARRRREQPTAVDSVTFGNSSRSTFLHPCVALTFLCSPLYVGLTVTLEELESTLFFLGFLYVQHLLSLIQ
jgi:hypothetical protein